MLGRPLFCSDRPSILRLEKEGFFNLHLPRTYYWLTIQLVKFVPCYFKCYE
uniref:Uncharacterized protein n=1 Tax=Anguilla anguilla TaxID=7936 RepID=A0A0E9RBW3_ANGAN